MRLPLSSKRIDAVLAGLQPEAREPSCVFVEFQHWSRVGAWEGDPDLVTVDHTASPRLHPVLQVRGHCEYLVDFTRSLHGLARAGHPRCLPHNATADAADQLLGELACQGRTVMHATGSRSFTQSLRKVAGKGSPRTARGDRAVGDAAQPSRRQLVAVGFPLAQVLLRQITTSS